MQIIIIEFVLLHLFLSSVKSKLHECGEFNEYEEDRAQKTETISLENKLAYFPNAIDNKYSLHMDEVFSFFSNLTKSENEFEEENDRKSKESIKFVVSNNKNKIHFLN